MVVLIPIMVDNISLCLKTIQLRIHFWTNNACHKSQPG